MTKVSRSILRAALLLTLPMIVASCGSDSNGPSSTGGKDSGADAVGGSGGTSGGGVPGTGGSGVPGTGGSKSDAAPDVPLGDAEPSLDGLVVGDSGPNIIMCPTDVATAACTPGTLCTRKRQTGEDEGCGCLFTGKWYCPGLSLGNDGGVALPDGGIVDAGNIPVCEAGLATGSACSPEGAICTGGPGRVGCACTQLAGALRWVCL
jgi:hypothetical protein